MNDKLHIASSCSVSPQRSTIQPKWTAVGHWCQIAGPSFTKLSSGWKFTPIYFTPTAIPFGINNLPQNFTILNANLISSLITLAFYVIILTHYLITLVYCLMIWINVQLNINIYIHKQHFQLFLWSEMGFHTGLTSGLVGDQQIVMFLSMQYF